MSLLRKNADVAASLAANEGADLSETSLLKIVERFGDDERVIIPLAQRAYLPVTVSERLVHHVSETLSILRRQTLTIFLLWSRKCLPS